MHFRSIEMILKHKWQICLQGTQGALSLDVNIGTQKIFLEISLGSHFLHGRIPSTDFQWPPPLHLCFLRMVLMTMVGAVLIDRSKLALVGIACNTIPKSWYPAYLRFNVYWNASTRCHAGMRGWELWDGWNMRAAGWGRSVEGCWRSFRGVVKLVKISGC